MFETHPYDNRVDNPILANISLVDMLSDRCGLNIPKNLEMIFLFLPFGSSDDDGLTSSEDEASENRGETWVGRIFTGLLVSDS